MGNNNFVNIILDSDFIFGFFINVDSNYDKARKWYAENSLNSNFILLNITKFEVITLVSRRYTQELAKNILSEMEVFNSQIFYVDERVDPEIWSEFNKYSKKNISLVDCANLVYARKLNAKIASFDKFYPSEILVQL